MQIPIVFNSVVSKFCFITVPSVLCVAKRVMLKRSVRTGCIGNDLYGLCALETVCTDWVHWKRSVRTGCIGNGLYGLCALETVCTDCVHWKPSVQTGCIGNGLYGLGALETVCTDCVHWKRSVRITGTGYSCSVGISSHFPVLAFLVT